VNNQPSSAEDSSRRRPGDAPGETWVETLTLSGTPAEEPAGIAGTLSKNIAISLARVLVNSLIALVLPAYLTHHMQANVYGAWVLILQLGAFVSFLDLGVQTAVAKFVAEYDAKADQAGASRFASAGLAITAITGLIGAGLTLILAWQVPRLFHAMPVSLYRDVRISVVLVGTSLAFGLVCSIYSAVFLGLQRYLIPTGIAILNRLAFSIAILAAVFLHGSLADMGITVAVVNIFTGLLQVGAWHRLVSRIRLSLSLVDSTSLKQMLRYCLLLAIWMVGMVCVSGLDITIVGHYAYEQTAYYSIATLPTNFVIVIIGSILGPLMPASSALSTSRSPFEMGSILARATRYSTLLLLLTGLPLIVYGFPILRLWVGPVYARQSLKYLQILVFANILRQLCAPYATMVAATGKLKEATAAPVLEAIVNLASSVYLASRFGAIGVAYGTLIGSLVSISLHFAVSMRFTYNTVTIAGTRLFLTSILRPTTVALPSLLLFATWHISPQSRYGVKLFAIWLISTILCAWFGSLTREERSKLESLAKSRLKRFAVSST